jgi:indolepyruvate ferredoxin oxidoreductase beta subunit
MNKTTSIVICGVGGQGILLASEIISDTCLRAGFMVRQSEVHGMAQRGGSVVSHVRFGQEVFSPLIDNGTADFIVSFELLEALRYLPFVREEGIVITNTQRILPVSVASGDASYPANILDTLLDHSAHLVAVDAHAEALALGDPRMINMVLIGALSRYVPFDAGLWIESIENRMPESIASLNIRAFNVGRSLPYEHMTKA